MIMLMNNQDSHKRRAMLALLLLSACLAGLLLSRGSCHRDNWDYKMKDYKDHPCNRPCTENDIPRLCQYEFLVETYYVLSRACGNCPFNQSDCMLPHCIPADGVQRGLKVANRMLPGPSIQVCQGDTVEISVDNSLDSAEATSIHWHGILQQETPHMDGVSLLTQCPITYHSHYIYSFVPKESGTHFWHSHSGSQRSDGLYGSFIVRKPPRLEGRGLMYNHDLSEHVILISDWLKEMTSEKLAKYVHFDNDNKPKLMLINGMGRYQGYTDSFNRTAFTPYASFSVKKGQKYRFRLINAGIMNCGLQFSIDKHKLTIIESDGSPVRKLTTDSITSYPGERFDFILDAQSPVLRNFWIRVRGIGNCANFKAMQTAILKYEGAPDVLPPERTLWEDGIRGGFRFNEATLDTSRTNFEITSLESNEADDDTMSGTPDKKFYMAIDFVQVENLRAHNPALYPYNTSTVKFNSPQVNWISFLLPPSPPLSQLEDLSEDIFCNAETVQKNCKQEWCACVHLYKVDVGDLVELIVLNEGLHSHAYHPMHLHGHRFRVTGMGKLDETTTLEQVKELDRLGKLNRTRTKAPLKDTVIIPDGGYTISRFRANNPGFWFYHCHVEFHAELGMGVVFQVGHHSQHPPKPKNFPTCGHWKNTG